MGAPGGAAGATAANRPRTAGPARLSLLAAALAFLIVFAACKGGVNPATPSPLSPPPSTPAATHGSGGRLVKERIDADRALSHVKALSVEIGSRPSGSEAEAVAADYIRDQLAGYGYQVMLQGFILNGGSQNVVARSPGGECQVVAGGHYDSVAVGPGANDNASGTATVLEMARVLAADGEFDDVCFVLFGAEEIGLIGSGEFVDSLSADEKQQIEGMLNFDMVGAGSQWLLVGSEALVDLAAQEADSLGLAYQVAEALPAGLGSDHDSFIKEGIPAMVFHRLGDPHYHTPEDRAEFVQGGLLAEIGEVGLAVIEALLEARQALPVVVDRAWHLH